MKRSPSMITAALSMAAVLVLGSGSRAFGATYSYFYTVGPQTNYIVAPNGTVTVPLYLQEVNSDQSTDSLLANDHGLFTAGVNVEYYSGSSLTTITAATANTGAVPGAFQEAFSAGTVNSVTSATITESTDQLFIIGTDIFGTDAEGVQVTAGSQSDGISFIYLGSVTIQASSIPCETTVFSVTNTDPTIGSTVTNDNYYNLDNSSDPLNPGDAASLYFGTAATNFTITTSSVPEPTTVGLLALGLPLLFRRARNRGT